MSMSEIFDDFFNDQIKISMYSGIESTMSKPSAHTCVLALSVYTEILGGLISGNLLEEGKSRSNYETFLPYLGQDYVKLNDELWTNYKTNLHKQVRSKLVHEFRPRASYWIHFTDCTNRIGIDFTDNTLNFWVREYYRDFKNGVDKYYNELTNWKSNIQLLRNFIKATVLQEYVIFYNQYKGYNLT